MSRSSQTDEVIMKQIKEDFEFILQIAQEFFVQEAIINKLKAFANYNIKGWEIWFQVEFALFLREHTLISEVEREKKFKMDQRKSKNKISCSIDFFIRQKHKHTFIPLELKQDSTAAGCIRNMIKDINKFEKIRCANFPTSRSLWCLGVHETVSEEHMSRLTHEKLDSNYVKTIEIQDTAYSFTLI
ncbi:MAG: hypothetical protein Q7U16_11870 [Agitococcus sp.]|nr:hypothetical protein [Agitococcus sp.]